MSLFNRKKNKQAICLMTETNSVQDFDLEAGTLHAESAESAEAWGLDSNQQAIDEDSGDYLQVVSAVSYHPVQIYKDRPVRELDVSKISAQTEDSEMVYIDEGRSHDGRTLWVGIGFAMLVLTLCIIALVLVTRDDSPAAAAAITIPLLSRFRKKAPKRRKPEYIKNPLVNNPKGYKPVNAMIFVEKTRRRVFRHVTEKVIPRDAFMKRYGDIWLYLLGLTRDGQWWAIKVPVHTNGSGAGKDEDPDEGTMPTDLYIAKHCATEVNEVYGLSMPTAEKIKLGIFVGLIVAIVIVIFLITASFA